MDASKPQILLPQLETMNHDLINILALPVFEGGSFNFASQISSNNVIRSNFILGSPQGSSYTFGLDHIRNHSAILTRLGNGNAQIHLHKSFTDHFKCKIQSYFSQNNSIIAIGDLEYADRFRSMQLRASNHGTLGISAAHTISNLIIGCECLRLPRSATESQQNISGIFAYKNDRFSWVNKICNKQIGTSRQWDFSSKYLQKVSDRTSFAGDLSYDVQSRNITSRFGYQYQLNKANISANINSHGTIQSYYEELISPGFKLILSSDINHYNNHYKFGYGITIG